MVMEKSDVTVVVVPRERFSHAIASLDSIERNNEAPFELLYVDGHGPRELDRRAADGRLRLIRRGHSLSPNAARNLALPHVTTKYLSLRRQRRDRFPGLARGSGGLRRDARRHRRLSPHLRGRSLQRRPPCRRGAAVEVHGARPPLADGAAPQEPSAARQGQPAPGGRSHRAQRVPRRPGPDGCLRPERSSRRRSAEHGRGDGLLDRRGPERRLDDVRAGQPGE